MVIHAIFAAICLIVAPAQATPDASDDARLPTVRLDSVPIEIDESCRIEIPAGETFPASDDEPAIRIVADGVTVEFAEGAALRGSPADRDPDAYQGIGVLVDNASDVTLRNLRIHGYRAGIRARGADGLTIEDVDLSDNFRQRLRSTPEAEDTGDWLWPHENDGHEWLHRYGAALYVHDSDRITIRRVRVREGQNGILLSRVNDSRIYDNDASFLSGWGLAMWRSSRNTITRNAFDFCVRGYSHGVYNRGQDSAGILMFEQCSENIIALNSATHSGDGLFGFAGREALGQNPAPEDDFDYERRGNNDNLIMDNDFSYAPAHGVEMTFSFGNRIVDNRLVGNAICGIWAGFSQETLIMGNTFEKNGDAGYGLERGGVNIEHGRDNTIRNNHFRVNECGVHLFERDHGDLLETPWAKANHRGSRDTLITENTFEGDTLAIHLRRTTGTTLLANQKIGVGGEILVEDDAEAPDRPVGMLTSSQQPSYRDHGTTEPVGAREHLSGREHIIMGPWGPWDHESPMIRLRRPAPGVHVYELFGFPPLDADDAPTIESEDLEPASIEQTDRPGSPIAVRFEADEGVHPYTLHIEHPDTGTEQVYQDTLIRTRWRVTVFPWTIDPREDLVAWRCKADGDDALSATTDHLHLHYAHGGPRDIGLSEEITEHGPGPDHFGTIARTTLDLPAGRWRITTLSDDGVRVILNGEAVLENWTHHAPTRDTAEFTLDEPTEAEFVVEHFEIDGYAVLRFDLERVEVEHPSDPN